MNRRAALWFLPAVLFATGAFAQYTTGFEPPFFSGQISGQDAWNTAANPATARVLTGSEIATELTNAGVAPGLTVHGGDQALVVSGTGASNATIRLIPGLETERKIVLEVWTRLLLTGSTGNIFLTMEDSTGDRAAAFRFGTAFGTTIDYGTNIASVWQSSGFFWNSDTWYRLTLSLDYSDKTYDFSIDGTQVNASPIPFYNAASDDFRQVRIFRGAGQAGMIVDDLTVRVIPEPTTCACLLLGGALLVGRRKRAL